MAGEPVIAVQSKVGELEALLHAQDDVQPMVDLLDKPPRSKDQVLAKVVDAAVHLAERGRPLWVDIHRLTAASALGTTPGGAFEQLEERVEARFGLIPPPGPALVPVVSEDSSAEVLGKVARLRQHEDRPVVVRVRDVTLPIAELANRMARVADLTGANDLHVVLDVGYFEAVTPLLLKSVVDTARSLDRWTSVTLLAGSVPTNSRTGYATVTEVRHELGLWREVNRLVAAPVRYGDYGVVHPVPARQGPDSNARQPNPYLHYTIEGGRIVLRRQVNRSSSGAFAEGFADLAGELVRSPDFAGHDYSWGDEQLEMCGRGTDKAGTSSRWIAMATSHHIRHVTLETAA
ncbi:hypothetical protein [Umezawaea sp. NPDC059074]|uniref:beta family protein n=1 Tax=Umezawaea sp. NPDC059074 TaxID=3346716 RepID=UPI0036754A5D